MGRDVAWGQGRGCPGAMIGAEVAARVEQRVAAVGFDLGETLLYYAGTPLNWAVLYPQALRAVAGTCRVNVGPDDVGEAEAILREYNTRLNPRTQEYDAETIIGRVLQAWRMDRGQHLGQAIEGFFRFFQQKLMVYEDVAATMAALQERGIRIGVLTDVPYGMPRCLVQEDLDAAGLGAYVTMLLTSVDVGWRKPEPLGFLRLAEMLHASPGEMLFVGNEQKDIIGANRAGMASVLLLRDGQREEWGQIHTIRDLSQLLSLGDPHPERAAAY